MIKIYSKLITCVVIIGMVLLFVVSGGLSKDKVVNEYVLYDKNMHVYVISKEKMEKQVSELNSDTSTSTSIGSYSVAEHAKPYIEWIFKYAKQYEVDPILVCAMCSQETDFGRDLSVSSAGAKGLMQFIDPTWQTIMPGKSQDDPEASIEGACKYIKQLSDELGITDPGELGYAYNAGPNRYRKQSGGTEAYNYRNAINTRYQAYKNGTLSIGYKCEEGD